MEKKRLDDDLDDDDLINQNYVYHVKNTIIAAALRGPGG